MPKQVKIKIKIINVYLNYKIIRVVQFLTYESSYYDIFTIKVFQNIAK